MTQQEIGPDPYASLAWDLSDRLRKALRVSGVSVHDMAESLGVERNTVGRYINGHTKPTRATLVAWAVRSGVPIEYLEFGTLPGEEERPAAPGGGQAFFKMPDRSLCAIRDLNPEPAD